MRRSRFLFILLVFGVLFFIVIKGYEMSVTEINQINRVHAAESIEPRIILTSGKSTTSWDARDDNRVGFILPLLYLRQNREQTEESERTLNIVLTGIDGGREIDVEIISKHENVETGMKHVETHRFALPDRRCDINKACVMKWTLDPQKTLSDFYTLRIKDTTGEVLWPQTDSDRPDFVILDRWDAEIEEYAVRIIYATLFSFSMGQNDYDNRLSPGSVVDFIEQQFVPVIVETWNTQLTAWGLGHPMNPDWDADHIIEIIVTDGPYALYGNIGTISKFIDIDSKPTKECRIWWSSSNNSFQAYRTLQDAVKSVYSHEFFHLVQRNILLFADSPENRWMNLFIEAQGKFASSVQYPDMELRKYGVQPHLQSEYLDSANRFLSQRLNSSYREMEADSINKFDAALYWRFLYEQYGHMQVARTALVEMTQQYQSDIVSGIAEVMDQSFAQHQGPFASFEDSLIAYARGNYALRLPDGRCEEEDYTKCEGNYYDPSRLYVVPPLEIELDYDGTSLSYEGAIPSSFGMDFIEIYFDSSDANERIRLTVETYSDVTQFNVQVWPIVKAIPHNYPMTSDPIDMAQGEGGVHNYVLNYGDRSQDMVLALIITRLDAQESKDPYGNYIVSVLPDSH